jgi:hypothetical protein
MLSVIILNVTYKPFMLSVVILSVIMLSIIMLSVFMQSVVMLNVVMLSVTAPSSQHFGQRESVKWIEKEIINL